MDNHINSCWDLINHLITIWDTISVNEHVTYVLDVLMPLTFHSIQLLVTSAEMLVMMNYSQ